MKKHTKIYLDYFNIGETDVIYCENCGKGGRIDHGGFDCHHIISKGMGGSKEKDYIENIILLCRRCHNYAHDGSLTQSDLFYIHKIKLC